MMSFLPTYVIKMPGSERNPGLCQSLDQLGIKYQIQKATVGKDLSSDEIYSEVNMRSCKARLGYTISKSLIGCALSHREVYRNALTKNFEWILIFEEDAILSDFDPTQIVEITQKTSNDPTVIQLFSRSARLMKLGSNRKLENCKREIFDFEPRITGCGASAYLINKAAMLFSQDAKQIGGPPDWPEWSHKVKFLGVYPWMTTESDFGSVIPLTKVSRSKYLIRRFMQFTFIHYLIYHKEYKGFNQYLAEEIKPFVKHVRWKLNGSKYYRNDKSGPQVII